MFVEERGDPFYDLTGSFHEKEMFIFKQQFLVSLSAGNTTSKFKRREKLLNFPGFVAPPKYATFLPFFLICNIFPIIGQCRFFNFWDRPLYSNESV